MSPVGTIFMPFPPRTGANLLHPRPPPPIVERVSISEVIRNARNSIADVQLTLLATASNAVLHAYYL